MSSSGARMWLPALRTLGFACLALAIVGAGIGLLLGQEVRHIVISTPWALAFVALPLFALGFRAWWQPAPATLRFSRTQTLVGVGPGFAARLAELPDGLRLAAALLLVLAIARPQSERLSDRLQHEGIDIAIALDLSDSMEAMDLRPNRLEAAKAVIDDFIDRRPRDRVAVVVFGATASTVAPLTLDHDVVRGLVAKLRLGVLDGSRTAIGAGLGMALNRLAESDATSKIVVLLTDGVHNADGIDPDTAATEAAARGVKVYTVLMGRHDFRNARATVDPKQLERIATRTQGFAYTAQDLEALQTTFQDLLDKLERSTVESRPIRAELFLWLLWPALALLLADIILRNTRLRRFP